jgi:hypothetical protein
MPGNRQWRKDRRKRKQVWKNEDAKVALFLRTFPV